MNSRILLLVLLTLLLRLDLNAQNCSSPPNCILNPGIDGSTAGWGNAVGTTLPNWWVLSGTPVFAQGVVSSSGFRLINGEGMGTCFNFQSGYTYRVCFRAYSTYNQDGYVKLQAHDGSSGSQNIGVIQVTQHGLQPADYSTTFTATSTFNQLRILVTNAPDSIVIDDVGVIEVPTISAGSSTIAGCGSTTLSLSANTINNMSVSWSPSTGLSSSTGATVTASPCQTTTYTATYTSNCSPMFTCISNTLQITVNVNQGTSVSASPATISSCQSTTLTASSTNPMNVTWSPSTGLSSTHGNVVTATPCKTTTYTASFYCPQNGCTYFDYVTVTVQPNGSIINNTGPCGGPIDLKYNGSPCPGTTYKWYGPKNPTSILSTGPNLYLSTSTPGDMGIYMLIVSSPQGCIDTLYETVVMNCCSVTADFDIVDCNPIRLVNKTHDGSGTTIIQGEWFWDMGDGTTSTLRNPAHLNVMSLARRKVCLTAVVSDGFSTCCDKVCKEFDPCDFNACPKAAFDFRIVNPGTYDVQFLDKSVGGGTPIAWNWTITGPLPSTTVHTDASQNPPSVPLGSPGTYTVCLQVTYLELNGQTCDDTWCEDIIIP